MTIERGLLDTSTVILLGEVADPASLPEDCVISAITLAELTVGPQVAASDLERAARQAHLQQAEADFEVLGFDAAAARAFGRVSASLRAAGRTRQRRRRNTRDHHHGSVHIGRRFLPLCANRFPARGGQPHDHPERASCDA